MEVQEKKESMCEMLPNVDPFCQKDQKSSETTILYASRGVNNDAVTTDATIETGNRKFTLSLPSASEDAQKNSFPVIKEISSLEDLSRVAKVSHCAAQFKDKESRGVTTLSYKSRKTFNRSDVIVMTVSNLLQDPTAAQLKPEEYVRPENIGKVFKEVEYYAVFDAEDVVAISGGYVPNNFKLYFPIQPESSAGKYSGMIRKLAEIYPGFAVESVDSCREIQAIREPRVTHFPGSQSVEEYLIDFYAIPERIPPEDTVKDLSSHASHLLERFGDTTKALEKFKAVVMVCEKQPKPEERQKIWDRAKKHYHESVETDPRYVPPDQYNSLERMFSDDPTAVTTGVVKGILKEMGISVRFNIITGLIEITGMPGIYSISNAPNILPTLLMDYCKIHNLRTSSQNIESCLGVIADEFRRNPVAEMLENADYDGSDRIQTVIDILGLKSDREKVYLKKWLHQSIAMALNDERNPYGADGVLVLHGGQGEGKTWFFAWLTWDPDIFAEGVSLDMNSKDSIIQATGAWIAELGELDSTLKREQSALKAFLTSRRDTYRLPYARCYTRMPRRTSFCATVNPDEFLNDETGSRRYWVIHVDHIDLDTMRRLTPTWVAKMWKQVYRDLYLPDPQGFRLTKDERKELEIGNQAYSKPLVGEIEIADRLDFSFPPDTWTWTKVSTLMDKINVSGASSVQVGKVLATLAQRDTRIKVKKVHNVKQYLLPPLLR